MSNSFYWTSGDLLRRFGNQNGEFTIDRQGFPPYDIIALNENAYKIRLALAGFKRSDIEISVKESTLTIQSKQDTQTAAPEQENPPIFIHKGIANRGFTKSFSLSDYVVVKAASLDDGILTIDLEREIPESAKPKMIEIK